eukprot:CAMPEP_0184006224 /NCGR_PEP_ID=MMETSP0954-20121128/545_1 /TAXON_ID=627963 /ORGANISM="Aplanochytrium sp, Strain PBS07" /LENGTH=546 /DNA_ID=CAMNT_0026284691 /DNA_START=36 /DNA_END=1676 /DNA_ORIENTATION=-
MVRKLHFIDGLRGLLHLSIIALHVSMMVTYWLPVEGEVWDRYRSSPLYSFAQAGGVQVDVFLMISGFFLVRRLIKPTTESRTEGLFIVEITKRFLRFWPVHCVAVICNACLGEFYSTPLDIFRSVVSSLFFVCNYFPDYVPLGMAVAWSSCVDIQFGIVLTLILDTIRKICHPKDILKTTTRVLTFLLFLSFFIRYLNFQPETGNLVKLGDMNHMGKLLGKGWLSDQLLPREIHRTEQSAEDWLFSTYNISVSYPGNDWIIGQVYAFTVYFPMHTRFGPMVVGGLLACTEKYIQLGNVKKYSSLRLTLKWLMVTWATSQLLLPCIPQEGNASEIPIEAQVFITVALRTLSSIAAAILLLTCLVPKDHPLHVDFIESLLSNSFLQWVGSISYCSYLIHFRIIQEMTLYYIKPEEGAFTLGNGKDIDAVFIEICVYFAKIFTASLLVSFSLATFLHYCVELPGIGVRYSIVKWLCHKIENNSLKSSAKTDLKKYVKLPSPRHEMDAAQTREELETVLNDLREVEKMNLEQKIRIQELESELKETRKRK